MNLDKYLGIRKIIEYWVTGSDLRESRDFWEIQREKISRIGEVGLLRYLLREVVVKTQKE